MRYALWAALLGLSGIALLLWETPAQTGTGKVQLRVNVAGLPQTTRVLVWTGPRKGGLAAMARGEGTPIPPAGNGVVTVPTLVLPVAYRRWVRDTIPRRTADLIMLRFESPGQPSRYLAFPLDQDWRAGTLAPRRILRILMDCRWDQLRTDPKTALGTS
jgi:hypothetical protein